MSLTPDAATDHIAQLLVHGVVATLMGEGLVHWAPLTTPTIRIGYRLTALAAPLVLGILFEVFLPFRRELWFQDASLFVSARWDLLRIGGVGLRTLGLVIAGIPGLVLLARDAWEAMRDAKATRTQRATLPHAEVPEELRRATQGLARGLKVAVPELELLVSPDYTLHCRGLRRRRILVSTGTLGALSGTELNSAIAHELVHLAHNNLLRGWTLFALRTIQFFNPFAQAVGRRAVQEIEWKADDGAAATTGAPLALARALVRCARHRGDQFLGLSGQGRLRALEERCRRLMSTAPAESTVLAPVLLLWLALAVLLVFVQ